MATKKQRAPISLQRLKQRREEILRIAARHGAYNVRVFGSVVRGEAQVLSARATAPASQPPAQ